MKAEKTKVERLLKTARGQIDGVLKMLDEDQYCLDVANQIMAAQAVLRRANKEILAAHMQGCVRQACCTADSAEQEQKLEELTQLLEKLLP